MNFLTSDYAKLLGKNAIITILSLMLIGGASVAGAKGIEKLQLNLDKNLILKSQLSQIADGVITAKDGKVPSAKDKKIELKQMSIGLIDLLSKLGGQYGVKSDPTGTYCGSFTPLDKGKGWASDFKKKFNEVKKKVYKELTSEEAQLIGATTLTAIILGIMGYGTGKAIQYRNSLTTKSKEEVIPKTNTELINEAISSGDNEKLADALAKSIKEGEGATPKTLKQLQDTEFEKNILDIISKKSRVPATRQDILEAERDLYDREHNPTGIVFPKGDPHDSSDEDEYYDPPTSKTKPPHMKGPGLKGERSDPKGGKVSSVADIKKYIHKVVTSKEAKGLGIAALTSLIMAGLGTAGYKVHQYARERRNPDVTDSDFIKVQRNNAKLKAKEKDIIPIKRSTHVIDMLEDEDEDELDRQDMLNIKLSPLYESTQNRIKNEVRDEVSSELKELDDIFKNIESETMTSPIAKPTITGGLGLKGGKLNIEQIKNYIHKVVTSKEAKGLGVTALTSLIMAGIGVAGYKAHQYANRNGAPDSDFIKSQRTTAHMKEFVKNAVQKDAMRSKKKKISPIIKSIDPNYDQNNDSSSDDEAQKNRYKLHLEKQIKKAEEDARLKVGIVLDDIIHKVVYNDNVDKVLAKRLANNLVDSAIDTAVANHLEKDLEKDLPKAGEGLKGRGFVDGYRKVKDEIYKIITSPNAKAMGIAALSTLIITALGGVAGFHMIKRHDDKLRAIDEGALRNSRNRNFIKEIESEWKPEYKEGESATHFSSGMGLRASEATQKSDTNKRLEIASKKITDLIQYARDIHLDKTALVTLITFLLGGAGYAGFKYIKGKVRESEPLDYIPEGEVIDALEEFATGKHRMSRSENIKADTKNANMPWGGFGLKHFLKGGDLSKFGEYAKKKEEAEKKAKPFAEKITDWIYSDEAKLLGKAGLQYSILTALGLLTAYAGKKAGEKAISLYPKDRSKINDPDAIMASFGENAPTGDTEAVQTALNQYATNKALRKAFKPDPTILKPDTFNIRPPEGRIVSSEQSNLSRYLLENPNKTGVSQYLKDMGYNQPYNETILRDDPALATIFSSKAYGKKGILDAVNRYEPPSTGTYRNPQDISDTGKVTRSHKDVYQGIKNFLNPESSKVEESKEDFESVMKQVVPTIKASSMEAALEAQRELEKNRPNLTVKQDKPSYIVPPKKSVKSISSMFSGTSAPTPESQKVVKSPPVKAPVEKSNPYISAMLETPPKVEKSNPEKKDDEGATGKGLKEDFTKTMNKAGDAIYNVITSSQVQGVAGGVTAGLIVSVLSMLMHEKRQETLASRRAIANRPPRPPPVSTRRRVRPPPRGDSDSNPFTTQ
jgi:hypothetical protein